MTRSTAVTLGVMAVFFGCVVAFGPLPVFGVALAVVGVVLVLRFPMAAMYGLVVLLPFNALVSQVFPGTVGTAYGATKDAIVALLLLAALAGRRFSRVPSVILFLVLALVTVPLISGLLSPSLEQALYGWRNDYEPLLLLIVIPALVDHRQIRRLLLTIAITAQVTASIALITWTRGLQWLLDIGRLPVPPGQSFPTSLFSSGSLSPRAFSPYVAPNELAAAMLVSLAVIWCVPRVRPVLRIVFTVLPVVAILASESRSGLFGAVVVGAVLVSRALRGRSAMLSAGFLTMAAVSIATAAIIYIGDALSTQSDSSFGGHADSLQEGFRQMLLHPLGMGLGMVGPRAAQFDSSYHVESFWLLLALESGPLVLVLFIALLATLVSRAVRSESSSGFLAAAAIGATLVSQLVLPTLQEGPVSFLLWLAVGLSLAAQQRGNEPSADSTEAPTAKVRTA